MNKNTTYTVLTYAGTLPFIACAVLACTNISDLPLIGSIEAISAAYALLIVAFMAGTHWGSYLVSQDKSPVNLFITSNFIAIIAWLVFLGAGTSATLSVSIVAFACLLWIDYKLYRTNFITLDYLKVRRNATVIVIVCLLLTVAVL